MKVIKNKLPENSINHIVEKIKLILKENKLKTNNPLKLYKKYYVARCKDENNNSVILKVRINKDRIYKNNFLKEIEIIKLINYNFKKIVPVYFKSQTKNSPEWIIFEYIKGGAIGNIYYIFDKYSNINHNEYIRLLDKIRKIDINKSDYLKKKVKSLSYKEYQQFFKKFKIKKIINNNQFTIINNFINRNKKLINKNCVNFTHGDFHPGNLLLDKDNLIIIDWDKIHYNLPTFDLSSLYLTLWPYKIKQKSLINSFFKKFKNYKEIKKLFILTTLYHLIGKLYAINYGISIKEWIHDKNLKKKMMFLTRDYYKNTIEKFLRKIISN